MTIEHHALDDLAIPADLAALSSPRRDRAFLFALVAAVGLHLAAVFLVSFVPPESATPKEAGLEVLILKEQGRQADTPAQDAALSERNRAGDSGRGNATETDTADLTPLEDPVPPEPEPAPAVAEEPAPAPPPPDAKPERTPNVLTARRQLGPKSKLPDLASLAPVTAADLLASSNSEIARLSQSIRSDSDAYAKRLRRRSISASTREFRYANYLNGWARKVERIGNLNYPEAAKRGRLYGNLILAVSVRADGSVERMRVVKSSGFSQLDEAAMQIVELAAPFSPLPPDIAAETDVLEIIRTWQFTRGGQLGWER